MIHQLNIFSILDSPALGGAEQYLLSNLEYLAAHGFKITLATYNQDIKNKYQDQFNIINFPYRLDVIGNKKGLIKFFAQAPLALYWLIKNLIILKNNYQQVIVYTPGFTERLVFSPFIKILRLKLIWLEYGPVQAVFKCNFGLPRLLYQLTHIFPDKVITISKHSQKSIINHTSIDKNKISIIYPGVKNITNTQLKVLKKSGLLWKKKYHLESKKIVSFVGRLAHEKEVDVLIKAFAQLKLDNTQLVIIGRGPALKTYQQLVKKLKIKNKVLFTKYVSEQTKNSILTISDAFVFPSAWNMEGFGMTTIEAMMTHTPTVSTGEGPQAEIIINGKTGLTFTSQSSVELSQKIKQLLTNKKLSNQLANNAHAIAIKKFTQTQMNQKTLELIQSCCD